MDTFSLVVELTTIRTLFAVSTVKGWYLHQLDINNIFLHGDLKKEVYMTLPLGFKANGNQVYRLIKSLYGLKQASRQWHFNLIDVLKCHRFTQATSNSSLFLKYSTSSFIALLIYVDDVMLASDSLNEIQSVKDFLHVEFKIKDLGELKFFLGLEVPPSLE